MLNNPFCNVRDPLKLPALNDRIVYRAESVELNKKTATYEPVISPVDLQEEIDKCRDLAGVDNMKRLLATGQAVPEDFYDDGQHGVDNSVLPADRHEAARQADLLREQASVLADELGVKDGETLSASQFEKLMAQYIKDHADKFVKASEEDK